MRRQRRGGAAAPHVMCWARQPGIASCAGSLGWVCRAPRRCRGGPARAPSAPLRPDLGRWAGLSRACRQVRRVRWWRAVLARAGGRLRWRGRAGGAHAVVAERRLGHTVHGRPARWPRQAVQWRWAQDIYEPHRWGLHGGVLLRVPSCPTTARGAGAPACPWPAVPAATTQPLCMHACRHRDAAAGLVGGLRHPVAQQRGRQARDAVQGRDAAAGVRHEVRADAGRGVLGG